jgi:hypothetical protein
MGRRPRTLQQAKVLCREMMRLVIRDIGNLQRCDPRMPSACCHLNVEGGTTSRYMALRIWVGFRGVTKSRRKALEMPCTPCTSPSDDLSSMRVESNFILGVTWKYRHRRRRLPARSREEKKQYEVASASARLAASAALQLQCECRGRLQ